MEKKKELWLLVLPFLWCFSVGGSFANTSEGQITMTMSQFNTLRNNNKAILKEQEQSMKMYQQLERLTKEQEQTLEKQSKLLQKAETQSKELESMLKKTNESFKMYAKEQKQEQNKLKQQRNLLAVVLGLFIVKQIGS